MEERALGFTVAAEPKHAHDEHDKGDSRQESPKDSAYAPICCGCGYCPIDTKLPHSCPVCGASTERFQSLN